MNKRAFDSFLAFRMPTATWAGSAFRPVLSTSVNRAVRNSFTFSENLTLPLGLLTAHPVRRDEWGEVSPGEVSGVLESNNTARALDISGIYRRELLKGPVPLDCIILA